MSTEQNSEQKAEQVNQRFTYKDYLTWPKTQPGEILKGVAYARSPAPSVQYLEVLGNLYLAFGNYSRNKQGRVFPFPFEVRLPENPEQKDEDIQTVVQPDLTVVCNEERLDEKGCKGAPDLIIEVLAENTLHRDLYIKLRLYEKAGVPEYWVVHPKDKTALVFILEGDTYNAPSLYRAEDEITVGVFPDLKISLKEIFR